MADLSAFADEVLGLTPPQRDALLALLAKWRNEAAGIGPIPSALATGLNLLTWTVYDVRRQAEEDSKTFDRMMRLSLVPAEDFNTLSLFDAS